MELRQELLEHELEIMVSQKGYECETTKYHFKKYMEEFGETIFLQRLRLISENKSLYSKEK